jgi:hypothetical protein
LEEQEVVLSPEEEREFWSAVGANDVSREKLNRVLDRSVSYHLDAT